MGKAAAQSLRAPGAVLVSLVAVGRFNIPDAFAVCPALCFNSER